MRNAAMRDFVRTQNVAHFLDLLDVETEPRQRKTLAALLIREIEGFEDSDARLEQADRIILRSLGRLDQQRSALSQLASEGCDTASAERLLGGVDATLRLLRSYRDSLRSDGAARPLES